MATVNFVNRDMTEDPITIGEMIELLKDWGDDFGHDAELMFCGERGTEDFYRFKVRGEKLLTIELRDRLNH